MMNICMALFRISLELITYIFIQVQRYLGYAEIVTSFFIHIYLGQCEIILIDLFLQINTVIMQAIKLGER